MGKPSNPLYKTCSSCGLQKPLSAFLQLSGPNGTTYGNICASCRKAESEGESKSHKEEEGTRRQVGGSRIGAQERVAAETEKERIRRDIDERYHEGRDDAAVEQSEVAEKKQNLAQNEKKRKETFLEKNRSYSENNSIGKQATWQEILADEVREQKPDFTTDAPTDTAIAGKSKYVQSSIFQQFMSWLNKGSAMARASDQAKVRRGQAQPPKAANSLAQPKQEKQTLATQTRVLADTKPSVKSATSTSAKETKVTQTQQTPAQTKTISTPRTETKTQPATQNQNAGVRRAAEWNSRLTTKSLFNTQEKTAEKVEPAKEKAVDFVKKNFTPRTR